MLSKLFLSSIIFYFMAVGARAETIHYSIRQMGFDGQADMNMVGPKEYKGHKTYLIVFKAHGVNYWDEEDIYLNPKTFRPVYVLRDFSLGAFGHGKILEDYVTSKGEIIITKTDKDRVTKQIIHNTGKVDNIYGLIYRYRHQGSFKTGDTVKMTLPTRVLKMKLVKQTSLKIDKKTYDAYFMQSQPPKYKIWFDASKNKIPLRITGTIGFINSVMTMTSYEE